MVLGVFFPQKGSLTSVACVLISLLAAQKCGSLRARHRLSERMALEQAQPFGKETNPVAHPLQEIQPGYEVEIGALKTKNGEGLGGFGKHWGYSTGTSAAWEAATVPAPSLLLAIARWKLELCQGE